jgi:hypothetical protein
MIRHVLSVPNVFCVLLDIEGNSIDGRQHVEALATAWLSKHVRPHHVLYCFYRKYATALSIRLVLIKIKYQKEICLDIHREQGVGHSYSEGFMVKYDESVKNAVCVFPHYTQRSTICTTNHRGDTLYNERSPRWKPRRRERTNPPKLKPQAPQSHKTADRPPSAYPTHH